MLNSASEKNINIITHKTRPIILYRIIGLINKYKKNYVDQIYDIDDNIKK